MDDSVFTSERLAENLDVQQIGDPRQDIRYGAIIVFGFFVVLLGMAAIIRLDAGVYAQGVIAVSGNRQAVQHAEGGIIASINVREGQRVKAGTVLVEMASPELRAMERALTSDYLTLIAQRERLLAERRRAQRIDVPAEFNTLPPADRELASEALQMQRMQFEARRSSLGDQRSVLGQRSKQLAEQQSGYGEQRASLRKQQGILEDELAGHRELAKKGFASLNRIRELERMHEELKGREAAMTAEIARAREGIGETNLQSLTLKSTSLEDVAAELRDTQLRLTEVTPRLVAARENLRRTRLVAPVAGQIVGLAVFTVGGVIAPGEVLMEMVPENRALVLQVRVQPRDADDVYSGQDAQIRFLSVSDSSLPLLNGRVRTISADSLTDQVTGQAFFQSEVEVSPGELRKVETVLAKGQLRPGLPVEVVIAMRKRTAFEYLVEPLLGHFWRAFREN